MPIYAPIEYKAVLARIREKVSVLEVPMGPCLSEAAIADFEGACGIRLPEACRLFLQTVGDGCSCAGFPLRALGDAERRDLSRPFQLEEAWVWEDDPREEAVIQEEIKTKVCQGTLELIDFGCCDGYSLIVTGACRGEVWNLSDVGAQPCCPRQDFLGWFELWLDNQEQTDYFKDYPSG